jgi:hypothetical protein
MILSISEAARRAKVSRPYLYMLKRKGKISFVKNENEQNGIELSELARLYPKVMLTNSSSVTSPSVNNETSEYSYDTHVNKELINQKIDYLQEKISMLENKNSFLEKQLEMEQGRTSKLLDTVEHQTKFLLPKGEDRSKSFWRRLKGTSNLY